MRDLLWADNVSFRYAAGAPLVVDGVTVRLADGVLAGILGPNGSGKTTLLRLLSGTRRPTAGHVLGLKDVDTPFPIDATAKVGETAIKAKGTLTNVAQLSALDLQIELKGRTMSELYDVIGLAFPETSPYTTRLDLRLVVAQGELHFLRAQLRRAGHRADQDRDAH